MNPGDALDSPLNVPPTGTLHGAEFASWTVHDAVGGTISTQTLQGDTSYGFVNYNDNTLPGFTNRGTTNATNIPRRSRPIILLVPTITPAGWPPIGSPPAELMA